MDDVDALRETIREYDIEIQKTPPGKTRNLLIQMRMALGQERTALIQQQTALIQSRINEFEFIPCLVFQAFVDPKEKWWTDKHHKFKGCFLLFLGGLLHFFFWCDTRIAAAITKNKEKNMTILIILTNKSIKLKPQVELSSYIPIESKLHLAISFLFFNNAII